MKVNTLKFLVNLFLSSFKMADKRKDSDPYKVPDGAKDEDKPVEHPETQEIKYCNKCPYGTANLSLIRAHARLHLATEEAAEEKAKDKDKARSSEKTVPAKQPESKVKEPISLIYNNVQIATYYIRLFRFCYITWHLSIPSIYLIFYHSGSLTRPLT